MKKIITTLFLLFFASCSQQGANEPHPNQSMKSDKLVTGDRIHLSGGYDFEPKWLKNASGYNATVLGYIDNGIEGRKGDERLSAIIEFDEEIEFDGFRGRFGLIMGRWENQQWIAKGVVHVHLTKHEIKKIEDFTEETAKWMESHANYKKI